MVTALSRSFLSSRRRYTVKIRDDVKVVDIVFNSTVMNFNVIKPALKELKQFIAKGYKIKLKGYMGKRSRSIEAFQFALSLLGKDDCIVFINKSRYSKAERRKMKIRALELRMKGFSAKQISKELNIPLKTVYRWIKLSNR